MRWGPLLLPLVTAASCVAVPGARLRPHVELGSAPHRSGLYITAADFEAGRLSDVIPCESASRPVARDAFSRSREVVWPRATRVARYAKSDLFGFYACDGTEVRFVRGANYRVVRAPPLLLYEHDSRVSMGNRGVWRFVEHAFSATAGDSVRPLTIEALKREFPGAHRFHDMLDLAFRTDEELIRYDDFHHEYRVARLLRQSREVLP